MTGWHLVLVASPSKDASYSAVDPEKETEWLLIDPQRVDRFGHAGETIIPGAGLKWKHLHRHERSSMFQAGNNVGSPTTAGPPAAINEHDFDELPWQVIFLSKPEKVWAYRHEEAQYHRTVQMAIAVRTKRCMDR